MDQQCSAIDRAGFSLSRALFRKNAWALTRAAPDGVTPIFPEKNWRFLVITVCQLSVSVLQFFGHHCCFYSFHSGVGVTQYFRHVAMLQKFAGPFVGASFCRGPYSAEHA